MMASKDRMKIVPVMQSDNAYNRKMNYCCIQISKPLSTIPYR
jgi:hypothetical protein